MKLAILLISTLVLTTACDGGKSKPKTTASDSINTSEVLNLAAFHSAHEVISKDSYSPEALIEITADTLTRTTVHTLAIDPNDFSYGVVRYVQVYQIENKQKVVRLTKLLSQTTGCTAVKNDDDSPMNISFQRNGENKFSMVLPFGVLSGLTQANQEQIDRIHATPECNSETRKGVKTVPAVPPESNQPAEVVPEVEPQVEQQGAPAGEPGVN